MAEQRHERADMGGMHGMGPAVHEKQRAGVSRELGGAIYALTR
jgi:hypothetical protein